MRESFLISCLFAVVLALSRDERPVVCNERPIVGILTEPTEAGLQKYGTSKLQAGESVTCSSHWATCSLNHVPRGYTGYVVPSYAGFVKWVEASGMRAAPIPFDAAQSTINKLFHSVNGILVCWAAYTKTMMEIHT